MVTIAWYGKLPARGDFVGRGLPPSWRREWDAWLQQGCALAAQALGSAAALRERLHGFEPWRYLAMTSGGERWCGIVVASQDRVGRAFPLTLVERGAAAAAPAACAARLAGLLDAAWLGPDELDAAIAALPPPDAGVEPAADAVAPGGSLWWPAAAGADAAPISAAWPPEPALLLEVLGVEGVPQPSAPT